MAGQGVVTLPLRLCQSALHSVFVKPMLMTLLPARLTLWLAAYVVGSVATVGSWALQGKELPRSFFSSLRFHAVRPTCVGPLLPRLPGDSGERKESSRGMCTCLCHEFGHDVTCWSQVAHWHALMTCSCRPRPWSDSSAFALSNGRKLRCAMHLQGTGIRCCYDKQQMFDAIGVNELLPVCHTKH